MISDNIIEKYEYSFNHIVYITYILHHIASYYIITYVLITSYGLTLTETRNSVSRVSLFAGTLERVSSIGTGGVFVTIVRSVGTFVLIGICISAIIELLLNIYICQATKVESAFGAVIA